LNKGTGEIYDWTSPYFETPEELERFCARHIQRFKAIIADDPEAPAPDASDWDSSNKIA
jgi:hypothetical protein